MRAAAFCSEPVEPTPARPGSTRKRVIPNKRSRRPPNWLEIASERIAEAPAVPLWDVPPLRAVASELVCPSASKVTISFAGRGGSERYASVSLLAGPLKFNVISYCWIVVLASTFNTGSSRKGLEKFKSPRERGYGWPANQKPPDRG